MRRQETVRSRRGRGLSKTRGKKKQFHRGRWKRKEKRKIKGEERRNERWAVGLGTASNNQNQIHEQILK